MANDQQQPVSVEDLLAMVDMPGESPAPLGHAPAMAEVLTQRNPLVEAFLGCVEAWRDVMESSGLGRIGAGVKYTVVFSAFTNRFAASFKTDELGQYADLEHGRKLRPIDSSNHALFFRAVKYRFE
jgi:hypothetical protein